MFSSAVKLEKILLRDILVIAVRVKQQERSNRPLNLVAQKIFKMTGNCKFL